MKLHATELATWIDPLDALAHAAGAADLSFLHSGAGQGFSVLGLDPLHTVQVDQGPHALDALEKTIANTSFESPHPLIGSLGFLSYDIGATLEHIPPNPSRRKSPDAAWPLLRFTLYRHYLLFNNQSRQITAYSFEHEERWWEKYCDTSALKTYSPSTPGTCGTAAPGCDRSTALNGPLIDAPRILNQTSIEDYLTRIQRIQTYIANGDIYQANLAQQWQIHTPENPAAIFRRLCQLSPAPFAAYLQFSYQGQSRHVLSASPELFLTLDRGHLVTRPIKGTRPRDPLNPTHDAQLRDKLLHSAKDQAELAMIVDLLRNDLGRVASYGSVRVTQPRALEPHPTVWHTAATIEADLRPNTGLRDILAAVCPGGSITGAPKIRAMQIIEELEPFRRHLYCGNIGVIGPAGQSLALNIAIRTILMEGPIARIFAGGGIVADSIPHKEYEETLHKAGAMLRALRT